MKLYDKEHDGQGWINWSNEALFPASASVIETSFLSTTFSNHRQL